MSTRVAIRIGYHKCASTHLGLQVLPKHPQIRHLGKPYSADDPVREVVESIIDVRPFDLRRCRDLAAAHVMPSGERAVVSISDGRLAMRSCTAASDVAERLQAVFGGGRILITIRRHVDFVTSLYVQDIGTGRTVAGIDDWMAANWDTGLTLRSYAAFAPVIARYRHTFGQDRVWVSLLEQFTDDMPSVAAGLGAFLGVDSATLLTLLMAAPRNPRMSILQARLGGKKRRGYAVAKAVARRLPDPVLALAARLTGHHRRFEPRLGSHWRRTLAALAEEDCAALKEEFDLPVDRYRYRP